MGARVKRKAKAAAGPGTLRIDLFDPGMTTLHKVGLAGLWMTLKALERDGPALRRLQATGGSWVMDKTSVALSWNKAPKPFFDALFKESFRIDKNGLIWFPALGEPMQHPEHAAVLQGALLGSFLQHGRTREADKANEPKGSLSVEMDEKPLLVQYRKAKWYTHQKAKFSPSAIVELAGWHFPGGAVRHVGLGQTATALQETSARALALCFAPVGSIFLEIGSRSIGIRPQYALVLPEISDLAGYSKARNVFLKYGVQKLRASGTADAGLRILVELEAVGLLRDMELPTCRVTSFGVVPWASQQKTRVAVRIVQTASREVLRIYRLCQGYFVPRLVRPEKREPFWDIPQVPDLVAANLTDRKEWWADFSGFIADQERRKHVFSYERGGLAKMVENEQAMPDGPERAFVRACHEAWRRRMGQLSGRANREGASFRSLVNRELERLRVEFSRCKNATSLREAVIDFWSRSGGSLSPLQTAWGDVLPLMNDKNWRKAKDLALLALASYPPATKEEKEVFEVSNEQTEES